MDSATARYWRAAMRLATDKLVRTPLWEYPPVARKAVISERRRRFGLEYEYLEPHGDEIEGEEFE